MNESVIFSPSRVYLPSVVKIYPQRSIKISPVEFEESSPVDSGRLPPVEPKRLSPVRSLLKKNIPSKVAIGKVIPCRNCQRPCESPQIAEDFQSPAVVLGFLILNNQRTLIPSIGQGFTFPDSNQIFHYLQLSRIYFPQQGS